MISQFEQELVTSNYFQREFRVSVGPPRGFVLHSLFQVGEPVRLPDGVVLATNYSYYALLESDGITLINASGLSSSGSLVLDPYGEPSLFTYDGIINHTLQNVNIVTGNLSYDAGTYGVAWIDITDRVTEAPVLTETDEGHIRDWKAELSGVRYNSNLMYPDCSILIEERYATADMTFSDWIVFAIGYIGEWKTTGDKDGARTWSATLTSIRHYVDMHGISARRYGRINLAEGATITTSGELASPYLEPIELVHGIGETSGQMLLDENPDTGWISDEAP